MLRSNGPGEVPYFFIIICVFIGYSIVSHAIIMWRRGLDLPQLAKKFDLRPWPNDSLPTDLDLDGTSIAPVLKILNVYEGRIRDVAVAVFDLSKRSGRSTAYFTVIAARGNDPFGAEAFDPDLTTEKAEAWTLLYQPRNLFTFRSRLFSMHQIEEQIQSVRPDPSQLR